MAAPDDASRASGGAGVAQVPAPLGIKALAVGEMTNFTATPDPKPASNQEFKTLEGAAITLDQFKGRVVVVNFWATWCAPCRRELPSLGRLQERIGSQDLAVLAVSIDRRGADKVRPFLDEVPLPHLSVYLDQKNKLGRAFGTIGLPTTVVVDQKGVEVGRLVGPAEWDSAESIALITYLIEKDPEANPAK